MGLQIFVTKGWFNLNSFFFFFFRQNFRRVQLEKGAIKAALNFNLNYYTSKENQKLQLFAIFPFYYSCMQILCNTDDVDISEWGKIFDIRGAPRFLAIFFFCQNNVNYMVQMKLHKTNWKSVMHTCKTKQIT